MERYGEYLFDASSGSIRQCLTGIGVDDVHSCSNYQDISNKEKKNTVEAEVEGAELYKLKFYLEDREVF
jgi:hypothetical protein